MFKATKPFHDTITDYPQQPSLRIGRVVPKEAVNLAYYFNPTATDAEKILTAEAPRNTIDHRVEEAYRYLFDQASDDDSLFPGYVAYEDEEGYTGKLGRMFVQWYPETHVLTKHINDVQQNVIVTDKSEVPKIKEYSDLDGYKGNLFLDVSTFEVSKTRDESTYEQRDREIRNFELVYHDIFKEYVPQGSAVDSWIVGPDTDSTSQWPQKINVGTDRCSAVGGGNTAVKNYVNNMPNSLDGAVGTLEFIRTEYEPVAGKDTGDVGKESASPSELNFDNAKFKSEPVHYNGDLSDGTSEANAWAKARADDADNLFKEFYGAEYIESTGKYDYGKKPDEYDPDPGYDKDFADQKSGSIQDFLNLVKKYCSISNPLFVDAIKKAMADGDKDIAIYRTNLEHVVDEKSKLKSTMHFEATYKGMISSAMPQAGEIAYNVIAVYGGILKKTVAHKTQVATEYKAECHYSGIVRKTWETYDGMAYYRGAVTKGNSIGNMNPEDDNEVLMYPDLNGYLRRPVYVTDQEGNVTLKNYYKIETDYAYLTDVFKNGVACFWKYDLKSPLYDYRGPDARGFYEGDAVKVFTSALKDLPTGYEYSMKLVPAEYETVSQINSGFVPQLVQRPMRYNAQLFTSFLSTATDTYKATYNAFNDNDRDNIALDNGVTEEIYNYPFMIQNRDFVIESVSKEERTSRIKMNSDYENYIEDTRRYITFTFKVIAERKQQYAQTEDDQSQELVKNHRKVESYPITVSILNRDYALPAEYAKFEGRGMIISPQSDGLYLSPFDIILAHQAAHPPVPQDVNGIYIGKITDNDGAEMEYNPDYVYEDQKVYRKIGNNSHEVIGRYEEYENVQEIFITSRDTDFYFYTEITECEAGTRGGINIKCNPDGSGVITAETTIDTGFWNPVKENWTKKLCIDNPYFIEQCKVTEVDADGKETLVDKICIFPGIKVKCIDARHIRVLAPREDGLLDSWYPRIQFGHYSQILDQYGTHTKVCYTMPEYDEQHFSTKYLAPYVDIEKEQVEILNSHMVRTKCFPLYHTSDISVIKLYKKVGNDLYDIDIQNVSFSDGIIITKTAISENDNIVCDYTYLEESYVYRGYWRNDEDFARIDLNPNIYHTYSDMTYVPSATKPTKNLFNKVIYFFLRPSIIFEVTSQSRDDLTFDFDDPAYSESTINKIVQNKDCLYHKIDDNEPNQDWDIYVGSVYIRQNTSLHSTILIDGRTRGGGLIESMKDTLRKQLEPESDYYLDIGYYDGEPYQENGVIIIRLDQRLLKEFGGRFTKGDIEIKVKRWLGLGVYPIIEYVDTYTKRDMPQHSLVTTDTYGNILDVTPEIYLEYLANL